jgi:hypothetical protein
MRVAESIPGIFSVFMMPPSSFVCKNQATLEIYRKKSPSSDEDGDSFI